MTLMVIILSMDITQERRVPMLSNAPPKQRMLMMIIFAGIGLLVLLFIFNLFFGPKDKRPVYASALNAQHQLIELTDLIAEYELTPTLNNLNKTINLTTKTSHQELNARSALLLPDFKPTLTFEGDAVETLFDQAVINGDVGRVSTETLSNALTNTIANLSALATETGDEQVAEILESNIENLELFLKQLESTQVN